MSHPSIIRVSWANFIFAPKPWPFADEHREQIAAHFASRRQITPSLWNGQVLLAHEYDVGSDGMRVSFFETDFASFLAWWEWGFLDHTVMNCFSMGAIQSADGAFLLGVMAPGTAKPGSVYFPAGNPEPADIFDGRVDLAGNMFREVEEETGLPRAFFVAEPGWVAVLDGQLVALIRILTADEPATELRKRILAHLEREETPELADIRIVRSRSDLDPMMPAFVKAYLKQALD